MRHLLDADKELYAPKTKDRDGNLPLHSACEKANPSVEVIMMLIEAYPSGLEKKDKEGNLPLHSAIERGDMIDASVVAKMLRMYPGATKVKNKDGNLPLHSAFNCARVKLAEFASLLLDTDPSSALVPSRTHGLLLHYCCTQQKPLPLITKLCIDCKAAELRMDRY